MKPRCSDAHTVILPTPSSTQLSLAWSEYALFAKVWVIANPQPDMAVVCFVGTEATEAQLERYLQLIFAAIFSLCSQELQWEPTTCWLLSRTVGNLYIKISLLLIVLLG